MFLKALFLRSLYYKSGTVSCLHVPLEEWTTIKASLFLQFYGNTLISKDRRITTHATIGITQNTNQHIIYRTQILPYACLRCLLLDGPRLTRLGTTLMKRSVDLYVNLVPHEKKITEESDTHNDFRVAFCSFLSHALSCFQVSSSNNPGEVPS